MACVVCNTAAAQPSLPWTPGPAARHALELLVDEAGLELTTSQWPLPKGAVRRALDDLPAVLPDAHDAARERLRGELKGASGSHVSLTVRRRVDAMPGFAEDPTPGSSLSVRSNAIEGPGLALQLGARWGQRADADLGGTQGRLEEAAFVVAIDGVELQLASHRAWWSPGWQSSLAVGHNAPPLIGVGVQRASVSRPRSPALAWIGPWTFQLFIAQTQEVTEPARPFLIGNRVTLRPAPGLEMGFTRTLQWGGDGRQQDLGSLFRAVTTSGTNADTAVGQRNDPGNQMAGFDLRLRCPGGLRCVGYAQLIGEDEAKYLPSKYLGVYGAAFWSADGAHRVFAELAETGCRGAIGKDPDMGCAYRNFAYPQGYVSAGRWLGASAGPDSRLLTLGWLATGWGSSLKWHYGRIGSRPGTYSAVPNDPTHAGRVMGLSLRQQLRWGSATLTPELDWTRVQATQGTRTHARIGGQISVDLDSLLPAQPRPAEHLN